MNGWPAPAPFAEGGGVADGNLHITDVDVVIPDLIQLPDINDLDLKQIVNIAD